VGFWGRDPKDEQQKAKKTHIRGDRRCIPSTPQSRSDHRRGFTGTLLRSEIRTRGGHDNRTLIRLIHATQASQQLGLSTISLELGAKHGLIPHYVIQGQLHFEPAELNRWIRQHHIDILTAEDDFSVWAEE
jgi:hypothetical protein